MLTMTTTDSVDVRWRRKSVRWRQRMPINVVFLFTILLKMKKDASLEDNSPKELRLSGGKAVGSSTNKEKRMDLGIDYWWQVLLPRSLMKSIDQYQRGDKVWQKIKRLIPRQLRKPVRGIMTFTHKHAHWCVCVWFVHTSHRHVLPPGLEP